jgi:hypothetical protein
MAPNGQVCPALEEYGEGPGGKPGCSPGLRETNGNSCQQRRCRKGEGPPERALRNEMVRLPSYGHGFELPELYVDQEIWAGSPPLTMKVVVHTKYPVGS